MSQKTIPKELLDSIKLLVPQNAVLKIGDPHTYGDEDFLIEIYIDNAEDITELRRKVIRATSDYDDEHGTATLAIVLAKDK